MECYEGATMIKTFRGLIADGNQDTIVLHTNDGSTGYRIVKFQIFPQRPGTVDVEGTIMIWKVSQTTISTTTANVDFSSQTLLGAAYMAEGSGADQGPLIAQVIFDQEIFNQDIYVTYTSTRTSGVDDSMNYYIELEQVKLDINSNTVATLKDMRNTASPRP